jgi:predicted O-methyltransferase YrrM
LDSKADLTVNAVLQRAGKLLPEYQTIIADIAPEAGFGGVWESEMLLFYASAKPFAPKQILESGRGRGKSTCILAGCFPGAQIISVELDADTPNAVAAAEKLRPFPNVKLLSGDSHQVLPEHLQKGDAVLIDGPKDFNAVQLAIEVLQTGKPCVVFMHDFPTGAPARKFVARHWPNAFFSDDPALQTLRAIDDARDPLREKRARGYGTFACLPAGLPQPLWRLRLSLFFARLGF